MMNDAYEILQLHPSAVPEVIEAAYRALALLHHPDISPQTDASATMAELNWAYTTLRNPDLRAAYDRQRVPIPIDHAATTLSERVQEVAAAAAIRDPESPARVVLDFGRYAGMTLGELARSDPAYLEWLRRHVSGLRYRHQIDEVLRSVSARRTTASVGSDE